MSLDMRRRNGITIVELLVVVGIIGLLAAISIPAIQVARQSSFRIQCSGNLRQVGLAISNYSSTHNCLPPPSSFASNTSAWRKLLPDLGEGPLGQYATQYYLDAKTGVPPRTGPEFRSVKVLQCPADSGMGHFGINYAINQVGTGIGSFPADGTIGYTKHNGVFAFSMSHPPTFADVIDGLSQTAMVSEFLRGPNQWHESLDQVDRSQPKRLVFNLIPGATTNTEIGSLPRRCRGIDFFISASAFR